MNDVRGDIFYDKDSTGYYVRPGSTSRLNTTNITTLNTYGTTTLGNGNNDTTNINDTLKLWATDSGDAHFYFGESSSSGYGDHYYWDSSFTSYHYSRYAGTDSLIWRHDTRTTNRITYGRSISFDNYGKGIYGLYSASRYQLVFSMGDAYQLPDNGTSTGNLYGMAWSHPNAGGAASNLNDHGMLFLTNGGFRAAISSRAVFTEEVRGTLFRDYNNSGYYVDPFSTSNLNILSLTTQLNVGGQKVINNRNMHVGSSTNLATSEDWVVGTGSNNAALGGGFGQNGDGNSVLQDYDPFGRPSLVWRTLGNDSSSNADGGWNKTVSNLDGSKSYMYSVYVKRDSSSTSGTFYIGCSGSETLNMSGSTNGNPYFTAFGISGLPQGVWCLVVGILHANNHPSTSNSGKGGVWRLDTGEKIRSTTDYKMRYTGTRNQTHRTYLYYSTDPAAHLKWWGPGVHEMNGNEPNIGELSGGAVVNQGQTVDGDIYANRYYDRQSTGYYLDPASTSYLNDIRPNILYDRDNPAYYVDPYGFSNFGRVTGPVATFTKTGSGGTAGNSISFLVENTYANHSWGVVAEFRGGGISGTDRPAIIYTSPLSSTSWATGYYQTTNNFAITQDRGWRNGGWGTQRLSIDTNGITYIYNQLRTPIVYDYNNTGYYSNPASTSRYVEARATKRLHIGDETNLYNGVYQGSALNRPDLTIKGQYPQLNLMATRINNSTHGATLRFTAYDSANASSGNKKHWVIGTPGTNATMLSFGYTPNNDNPHYGIGRGWSSGNNVAIMWISNDRHVYTENSFRAPQFTDSDNTGYYLNPASTSNLNALTTNTRAKWGIWFRCNWNIYIY